mgnify:CR=1 FL=1
MKDYIRLKKVELGDRRIDYRFESSLRFFDRDMFSIWYDHDFEAPSAGIAAVPFAAVMAPFMWMSGADLELEVLDEGFADSLQKAKEYYHHWFSKKWLFTGRLKTSTQENERRADGEGVLYSGGLDALTTYIRHRDAKPELFSFFGADVPLKQTKLVEACRKSFKEFADLERVKHWCMESDFWTLFDHKKLKRWTSNWWGETCHAMVLAALTAPVRYRQLGKLWIASSHAAGSIDYGWGSDYDLDNRLHWGSTRLEEDYPHASRFEKMKYFKDFPQYHRFLRVCYTWWNWSGNRINCSRCEKCYRSICELLLNGVDPEKCNFSVHEKTFEDLKKALQKSHVYYTFFNNSPAAVCFWREMQDAATQDAGLDRYGSHEFFRWLVRYKGLETMRTSFRGRLVYWARILRWNLFHRRRV